MESGGDELNSPLHVISLLTPQSWNDYELIDCGGLEKLERFGKYILTRPEPQAVWAKSIPAAEWQIMSHARYVRIKGSSGEKTGSGDKGEWETKSGMPDQWKIGYRGGDLRLTIRLGLTSFGHIGIFPEQASNWDFLYSHLTNENKTAKPPRVLNLFAYTGGASLAACAAGAEVVHVDSVKPVVNWARENADLNTLKGISWVVEDALKFVRREANRGNLYDGIILDPPAYGRGPEGEKWILQDSIDEMIRLCRRILKPDGLLMLSLYSMGFSALVAQTLVESHFGNITGSEIGELYFSDRAGKKLPLGTFLRFKKQI